MKTPHKYLFIIISLTSLIMSCEKARNCNCRRTSGCITYIAYNIDDSNNVAEALICADSNKTEDKSFQKEKAAFVKLYEAYFIKEIDTGMKYENERELSIKETDPYLAKGYECACSD